MKTKENITAKPIDKHEPTHLANQKPKLKAKATVNDIPKQIVTLNLSAACTEPLCLNGKTLPNLPTNKSFLLLLHFAQHKGQTLCRDHVAETLWPAVKTDLAKQRLRSELWRLKQWFDLYCFDIAPFLTCDRNQLVVATGFPVQTDTQTLHDIAAGLHQSASIQSQNRSHEIYDLLEKFEHGILAARFDEWAETEKARVQKSLRECREYLFHKLCQQGNWREAVSHGQALIAMEPLDEYLHVELMRCYIALECRGLAVRQYAQCQKVLREELGITPSITMERLYRSLLNQEHLLSQENHATFNNDKPAMSA